MFIGSFPFGGMLGSCRRESMCMLTLISEKGKLIMLIKQALAYGNKSVTLKHFQKPMVRLAGNTQVNRMSRSRRVLATGGKQRIFGLDMVCIKTILFHLHSF